MKVTGGGTTHVTQARRYRASSTAKACGRLQCILQRKLEYVCRLYVLQHTAGTATLLTPGHGAHLWPQGGAVLTCGSRGRAAYAAAHTLCLSKGSSWPSCSFERFTFDAPNEVEGRLQRPEPFQAFKGVKRQQRLQAE